MKCEKIVKCKDCDMLYNDFGFDAVVDNKLWNSIAPAGGGILCANCIIRRINKLPNNNFVRVMLVPEE